MKFMGTSKRFCDERVYTRQRDTEAATTTAMTTTTVVAAVATTTTEASRRRLSRKDLIVVRNEWCEVDHCVQTGL